MKTLRKSGLWLLLLSKRLYKRVTFLVILILLPVSLLGYGAVASQDSGMLTLALAAEDPADPMAVQILDELKNSSQLLRFRICQTPQEAQNLVTAGKADAAWIFPAQMQHRLAAFVASRSSRDAVVRVVQREETIMLRLAREKLSGTLFSYGARQLYLDYLREHVPELNALSDAALMDYYNQVRIDGNLFQFSDIYGNEKKQNYLLSPIRGLLAIVVTAGALASAMYFLQDSRHGTFSWVPQRRLFLVELGCQMVSGGNLTAAALLCLALTGQAAGLVRELLVMLLFCLGCAAFSMLLRRLCGNLAALGILLPVVVVIMAVVCPVFVDLNSLRALQYLFPPTYYIGAASTNAYLGYLAVYTAVCLAGCWVLDLRTAREKA